MVRGGIVQFVPQQELAVGDIVYLETGNKVAADGRLLESVSLMSDESSLTGESAPVEKDASAVLAPETPVAERVNTVYFLGCFITGGTGKMVVTDVGDATQFGLIAREIQGGDEGKTPLQEKMAHLGKIITVIGAVCAALIFLIQLAYILAVGSDNYFADISGYFIASIVLMVAAVPEACPPSSPSPSPSTSRAWRGRTRWSKRWSPARRSGASTSSARTRRAPSPKTA